MSVIGYGSFASSTQEIIANTVEELENNWANPAIQAKIKQTNTIHNALVQAAYHVNLGSRANYVFWLDSQYSTMPNRFY